MIGADVIARKLLTLGENLQYLSQSFAGDAARLEKDPTLRAAVERWLQVAIEACIDIAFHAITAEGWTPPPSAREAFHVLAGRGRISMDLARRLGLAAGLRNLLVHDYDTIDLVRLAATVRDELDDLRTFAESASMWTIMAK
ncbi:MAG TPA: DUF86 domain-containing protein [Myxococcales bacterium]|nr:DUF86 domain-containing protein [Myxococcales bacterium]